MSERIYQVENMDCANCARELEEAIIRLDGVRAARVEFANGRLYLEGDASFEALQARAEAVGKHLVEPAAAAAPLTYTPAQGGLRGFWAYLRRRSETRLALYGGALILAGMLLSLLLLGYVAGLGHDESEGGAVGALIAAIYSVAMLIALAPIARSGWNTLRITRQFSINLLMTIAALGAILIGEYLEAATVIFLFAIGEALEGYTAERARDSIRSLLALRPPEAIRLNAAGQEERVPVEALAIGEHVLVKPGERIPADGLLRAGESSVNQAPITGESIPVHKSPGALVYAGTINGSGALEIEVTQLAADTTLARIIRLVEEAQSERAPSQRLIDRFAAYYTPAVVVLALSVAILPPLLFNAPFTNTATEQGWLYRALTMLVIACPCALVISTPVTVISAIAAAARRGVLIKGGAHLEALGQAQVIAFDKTGTLTEGHPELREAHTFTCTAKGEEACLACDDVLALAAAVERRSTHPLAQAVVAAAQARHLEDAYAPAESVETLAGRGVRGRVNDHEITIGSHSLFDETYQHDAALCAVINAHEAQGETAMLLHDGEQVRGYLTVADRVRTDSASVVAALHGMDLRTVMLTGDNATVAQAVGAAVGVDDVRAGLLPQHKVDAVADLMNAHGALIMVGDGINDTPALARATVGVAMGGAGSAQAMETADVVLMADDLAQLPLAIRLARFARSLIMQNIAVSLSLKAAFLLLAAAGGASLWAAVFADVGMSLLVTLNGMRPLRLR